MDLLEFDLIEKVRPHLINEYIIFEEVGFFNRSIDMVLIKNRGLITVEFKIKDWRQAITQVRGHLIVADYSYVCMPERKISEQLITLLKKYGIGLWLYRLDEDKIIKKVKAHKSPFQWEYYKKHLIERLKGGNVNG